MRLRSKAPLNQLGFAAIDNSSFFVNNTYVFGSLNTWGWVVLCAGVLQCLTAWGVFVKNQFARWFGVFVIGANMIVQFLIMPAYPLWSLTIILFDLLAMYGLLAHGRKTRRAGLTVTHDQHPLRGAMTADGASHAQVFGQFIRSG